MRRTQLATRVAGGLVASCLLSALVPLAATSPAAAASGWQTSIVPFNVPGPSYQALYGVACLTTTKCVAVGGLDPDNENAVPLVEISSGSTWTAKLLHSTHGPGRLSSVSCPTTTWCLAVGEAFQTPHDAYVATYSDGRWALTTSAMVVAPNSVSCTSPHHCVAAGLNSAGHVVVESWSGAAWEPTVLSGRSSIAQQQPTISCPTATWCAVVDGNLASVGAPGSWSSSKLSSLASAVSCWRVGSCVAAGSASWTLAAGHWNERPLPLPAPSTGLSTGVGGITCRSSTQCVAAATESPDCGHCNDPSAYVFSLNGATWAARKLPRPKGDGWDTALDVACTSGGPCVAVGIGLYVIEPDLMNSAATSFDAAAYTYNGHAWTAPVLPVIAAPTDAWLAGVSCTAADTCVAVGAYNDSRYVTRPLVDTKESGSWTEAAISLPADVTGAGLLGVSCVSSACVAVGWQSTATTTTPLVEELEPSGWTDVHVPIPQAGDPYWLNAVSCATADSCVAVGEPSALIETLASGTWSESLAPLPSGALNFENLLGVSCTSTTSCIAVGNYQTSSTLNDVVETLSGGSWAPSAIPDAPLGTPLLAAIGCDDASNCLVAASVSSHAGGQPVVASGPGSWTVSMPGQSGVAGVLAGAACISSTTCLAVGTEGGTDAEPTIVTVSSGEPSVENLSAPAGLAQSGLAAISCGAPTACVAVGAGGSPNHTPLVAVDDTLGS